MDTYVNSVDEVERITGIDFFPALPDNVEKQVEAAYNLDLWKKEWIATFFNLTYLYKHIVTTYPPFLQFISLVFLNIPNSPLQYSAFFLIFNNPEFNKFAIRYAIIYLFFHVYINYLISLQGFT